MGKSPESCEPRKEGATPLDDLLENLRRATVLVCADAHGLREPLLKGFPLLSHPVSTQSRIVRAAVALGMAENIPARWKGAYWDLAASPAEWARAISIIHHQKTYLALAGTQLGVAASEQSPQTQLAQDPQGYRAFLRGVAASHLEHAEWFAGRCGSAFGNTLVDVAGGLGVFSRSWVGVTPEHKAILVDLPGVDALLHQEDRLPDRVRFHALDLLENEPLPQGDLYLFANVLHLLPNWQSVLATRLASLQQGTAVAILEADPRDTAGILFDLQVHLRSGGVGGLLWPDDIEQALEEAALSSVECCSLIDPADPFRRSYRLWTGYITGDRSNPREND